MRNLSENKRKVYFIHFSRLVSRNYSKILRIIIRIGDKRTQNTVKEGILVS